MKELELYRKFVTHYSNKEHGVIERERKNGEKETFSYIEAFVDMIPDSRKVAGILKQEDVPDG